jgi:signal transduction histidine kinase
MIIGVLLFTLLQTFLIAYLIRLIREQKRVAIQKRQNEELYRHLLREERITTMSLLTASLAHELNQPLTAILFNAQAGLRFIKSGRLDAEQSKSILSDIELDVKRASAIIGNVRSLMKAEVRKKEKIDLKALILEVLDLLHTELKNKQVNTFIEAPNQQIFVFGDKVELQQLIINLVLNAVRALKSFTPDKRRIDIKAQSLKGIASVSIADSGTGLPETIKDKLFEAFVSTEADGMGIGLTVCKSIVQRHGGEIKAENGPEGGAIFTFSLPIYNHTTQG